MMLADFLLARIAEDERDVGRKSSEADYCDAREGIHLSARRALAECEAKRRIVAYCTPGDDAGNVLLEHFADPTVDSSVLAQAEPFFRIFGAQMDEAMTDVMKLLALPYANHPDYRQEWAVQ